MTVRYRCQVYGNKSSNGPENTEGGTAEQTGNTGVSEKRQTS